MSEAVAAEESVAMMVGKSFAGTTLTAPAEVTTESDKYEFDADFQSKVATHCLRDLDFMRKVGHLIKPDYFENVGEAALVNIGLRFYKKYNTLPDRVTTADLLKTDLTTKVIRGDTIPVVREAFKSIYGPSAEISNSGYVQERVAEFARHTAVGQAILKSVDMLQKRQFDKIEAALKLAVAVGINEDGDEYDYFERITERTEERMDRAAGKLPPQGITTGLLKMDELLYHRGWGKKELSLILGGAKSGKTTAMINFGKSASLAGKNVLYVTLEVSSKIISERLDASISDTLVKELGSKIHDVRTKIEALSARAGAFKLHEFPSGTFTPSMLRNLIERYKSPVFKADGTVRPAIIFDMVIVDYADIMAPDNRTNDPIENSKQIYLGLRAIAQEENVAMLTATQSNREGMKSTVAKMDHVADDINKVRTVDIMISINVTDEERANGEARLYFAASRNQESGFTIFIKQELAKMKFISSIIRIE